VVMVHAEDNCIINFNTRRLYAEGREAGRNIHLARPPLAEEAAIRRMILLAERSGCPLYVVHVSSESGAAAIAEARSRRVPVFGEVLHNYLAFTSEDYAKPDGTLYHNYPPLKSPADQDALWSAIALGDLDTVASDDFTIRARPSCPASWSTTCPAATTASRRGWTCCSPRGSRRTGSPSSSS